MKNIDAYVYYYTATSEFPNAYRSVNKDKLDKI